MSGLIGCRFDVALIVSAGPLVAALVGAAVADRVGVALGAAGETVALGNGEGLGEAGLCTAVGVGAGDVPTPGVGLALNPTPPPPEHAVIRLATSSDSAIRRNENKRTPRRCATHSLYRSVTLRNRG
jgi:hypothetical protein